MGESHLPPGGLVMKENLGVDKSCVFFCGVCFCKVLPECVAKGSRL